MDEESKSKDLGMERGVTRRDFLNGVAIGVGGSFLRAAVRPENCSQLAFSTILRRKRHETTIRLLSKACAGIMMGRIPTRIACATEQLWIALALRKRPKNTMILLSWVAASADSQQRASFAKMPVSARILILDNHDDFGGHAKRNEFRAYTDEAIDQAYRPVQELSQG